MSRKVRKVVIPAAGLGTRLFPATKAVPKELLPIAGRPLVQYAVEEAVEAGLELVIFVLCQSKHLIAEHFVRNETLERLLTARGKFDEANIVRHLAEMVEIRTVFQEVPLGLGDAIRRTRTQVGDEPFAVILPDAIIDAPVPAIRQLMDCYGKHPGCVVATQKVPPTEIERFGILEVVEMQDSEFDSKTSRVTSLTERPRREVAASDKGIFGRYILESEVFEFLDKVGPGFAGEIQLTDALNLYSKCFPTYAYHFDGKHYDAGSKLGFLQATLAYAFKDSDLAGPLSDFLTPFKPSSMEVVS